MKIGMITDSLGGLSFDEMLKASAELGHRLHQRLAAIEIVPAHAHVTISIGGRIDLRPILAIRKRRGRGVDAPVDAVNEIELPGAALDLPGAQRGEQEGKRAAQGGQGEALGRSRRHGTLLGSPTIIPGIMFELRWYMIHSDPAIVISRMTPVKM